MKVLKKYTVGCVAFALMAVTTSVCAQDRPTIYNALSTSSRDQYDFLGHEALDARYHIVDFERSKHAYTSPKPLTGPYPDFSTVVHDPEHPGYVLIAYVVDADGLVGTLVPIKCSARQACKIAIAATSEWHFEAATLDGAKVSAMALQEFSF